MMGNINNIMSDDSSELSDYKNSDNIVIEIDNYDPEKISDKLLLKKYFTKVMFNFHNSVLLFET